jgi:hypothetical protein
MQKPKLDKITLGNEIRNRASKKCNTVTVTGMQRSKGHGHGMFVLATHLRIRSLNDRTVTVTVTVTGMQRSKGHGHGMFVLATHLRIRSLNDRTVTVTVTEYLF